MFSESFKINYADLQSGKLVRTKTKARLTLPGLERIYIHI